MASNADTIKSFLVGLGFKVDESSMRKFASNIAVQTTAVEGLADTLKGVSLKVIDFTRNVMESMDSLYFASQRTKASAANLKALQYAASQVGVSSDEMLASLQNLRNFLRATPNAEGWLRSFGVETRDANGQLLKTGDLLISIKKRMDQLPQYRAKLLGDTVGMSNKIQLADTGRLVAARNQDVDIQKKLGLNLKQAADNANTLASSLRRVKNILKDIGTKAASTVDLKLADALNKFSTWLIAHSPQIVALITEITQALKPFIPLFEEIGPIAAKVLGGLLKWFNSLSPSTRKFIAEVVLIGGVVTAAAAALAVIIPVITAIGGAIAAVGPEVAALVAGVTALVAAFAALNWGSVKRWFGFGGDDKHEAKAGAKQPRGVRNNNPGNLNYAGQAGATLEPGGRFARFKTPQAGLDAMAKQLHRYSARGIDTTRSIINKYAPPGENNTAAYIAAVSKSMGVKPNQKLNLSDPEQMAKLEAAIIQHENGKNPYSHQMLLASAMHAGVVTPVQVHIEQKNTVTVTGASDPDQVASAVKKAQQDSNSQLTRAMQGRIR